MKGTLFRIVIGAPIVVLWIGLVVVILTNEKFLEAVAFAVLMLFVLSLCYAVGRLLEPKVRELLKMEPRND